MLNRRSLQSAQTSWRGLVVAPERRSTPYDADDYRYPQSVEVDQEAENESLDDVSDAV